MSWLVVTSWVLVAILAVELRRRDVLAARVSHEVRGPLCAALLALERLSEDDGAAAAAQLEVRRAARALDDLGRAPRRIAVEPVDVGSLLVAAAPGWSALAAAHGARLLVEPEAGLVVHGDRLKLAQACGNLVANAVEHGGGEVCVRARSLGGSVRVEVTDAGPGLARPVGVMVAGARVRRGRRGHGLVVAAGVAARHGGRLSAMPSPRGARVVLELPAASS